MISLDRLMDAIGEVAEADVPRLEDMRDAALAFIETQTQRYFGPVTVTTETVRGSGGRTLWLSEEALVTDPVTLAVSELTYPGATPVVLTAAATDGYELRSRQIVRLGGHIWVKRYEYLVTYSRGYAENHGPKDIEHVLIELVRSRYNSGGSEAFKSETFSGYSYTRFDSEDVSALPKADQDTLDAWRRLVFA